LKVSSSREICLNVFQDRANDTALSLPRCDGARAGSCVQGIGTFATSPGSEVRFGHANRRAKERGMSLVEVLVALTILAFALLGLFPLFLGAVKTAASANQLTSANTLVREKLEELNGYPRNDVRLAVPVGANSATFTNDLPSWYQPSTTLVNFGATKPAGVGWYVYPYVRAYTVEQFGPLPVPAGGPDLVWMTTPVTEPPPPAPQACAVKLVTVTVRPTRGPFPGLRQTTQSLYLRSPNG